MERAQLLKMMDRWLRDNIDDEELFMTWLYVMPDEATEMDFAEIAEDDGLFNSCTRVFATLTVLDKGR